MPVEYTNRRGDVYYLHAGKTRTGRPRYFFSRDPEGTPLDAIPTGFEPYESPEGGLVYLRKTKPVTVASFEREMVQDGVRRDTNLEYFLVDVQGNSLVVYLPTAQWELPRLLAEEMAFSSPQRARAEMGRLMRRSSHTKMMRFVLVNEDKRLFRLERWCFRGRIDNWVFLDGPESLETLVRKYVKHLGADSFFELM